MPVNFIQPSFAAGELAPSLWARVDLAKYHIGTKLLRNFFVHPHGGVSNRAGTEFVGRCMDSLDDVQLIPFQFSLFQAYVLEFGHLYMRVIMEGGYVLEPTVSILGISKANLGVVATNGPHGYNAGDRVFIAGTGTQLDSTPGRQYLVANPGTTTFSLTDLDGNPINTTNYNAYSGSGGTVARVYTLTTPYAGSDVRLLKWTQSADTLTLCHPNYPPADLTRSQHWLWNLTPCTFQPTATPPTSCSAVTSGTAGTGDTSFHFAYCVTAVMTAPASESLPSPVAKVTNYILNQNTGVQNTVSWGPVEGAAYYNVYKANPNVNPIQTGAMYGYIGNTTATSFYDTNIAPDFSQAPPQGNNPFAVGAIQTITILNPGSGYTQGTPLRISDSTGSGAVLSPNFSGGKYSSVVVTNGGQNYKNPTITPTNQGSGANITFAVSPTDGSITSVTVSTGGTHYWGNAAVVPNDGSGGTGAVLQPVISNCVIQSVNIVNAGTGYSGGACAIQQDPGSGATFSATLSTVGNYPSCCTYFQQRKVFAASNNGPQTIWMTQPGDYHNMDFSNPSKASDSITFTIAANQVNAIKAMVPMNNLVIFTSGGTWMLIGGYITNPQPVTPSNCIVAPQNAVGCSDLPPIVVNYDILYNQVKGSIVRDLQYNFYAQVYTGSDMSILSNHLFFGHTLQRWAYAEQPFYQIWAVREDGMLLSFTYLREQDVYAWAHHDSPGSSGTDQFLSVASIPENYNNVNVDSVYFIVQRTIPGINGGNPVKYVERMTTRNLLTNGVSDVTKSWFVDCGLRYEGTPTTTVTGLDHLNGATVSILGDGNVQPAQTVVGGSVSLPYSCQRITVGLPYIGQFQSLCMEPEGMAMQVQDYRKRISAVALRVTDTRGLKVGPNSTTLTEVKERRASVPMGSPIPLFTGDQRVVISNEYLVDDDVFIQQDNPLPCTILGVIPEVSLGDSPG